MIINIQPFQLKEIYKNGYSIDIIYLLQLIKKDVNLEFVEENPKLKTLKNTILRKGLISDEGKITEEGESLLLFISKESEEKFQKKKPEEDIFMNWWQTYPGTDTFEYKNKKFKGTRALRVKRDDCKAKIYKILNEGEYSITDLIEALKLEIEQKKENSIKTGQNKLSYMQNSLTYLNQRTFEPYMELVRAGHKSSDKQTTFSSIDI